MRERARRIRRVLGEVHREKVGDVKGGGSGDQQGPNERSPDSSESETAEEGE